MHSSLTETDKDIFVAALLTVPVIEPGARAKERISVFEDTLRELRRRGGAEALWTTARVDDM